jgi:hypothetical protein
LQDFKRNSNFSYLQSIILISSFIAGSNKESTDIKLFEIDKSKFRMRTGAANASKTTNAGGQQMHLVGKTKRFVIDRLIAIVDYFTSLEIEGAQECQKLCHTSEFYSCINSLVKEDLLKKAVMRTSGSTAATSAGGDDLVHIGFKCNFDQNFVEEVADKISFHIKDYLFIDATEE